MATTDLGKIAIVAQGDWDSTVAYERNDVVTYNGSSYISKIDVPSGTAITNTTYWFKMVKGYEGEVGVMPYSWGFNTDDAVATASSGFYRIAKIQINSYPNDTPIEFVVTRRFDSVPIHLYFRTPSVANPNPELVYLYYDALDGTATGDEYRFSAFVHKADYTTDPASSRWDLYVHKGAQNDYISVNVYVPKRIREWTEVTWEYNKLDAIPSGAIRPVPTYFVNGWNRTKMLMFEVAGNSGVVLAGKNGGECVLLLSCTGWNQNIQSGLWYISGYSDSSRATITPIVAPTSIRITPVSNQLAWTIANDSVTKALFTCVPLRGELPTIT